jgi:peptidyl-dipeptidase Dcp
MDLHLQVFDIDKYHPEVMTYEVTDEKKADLVAIFDFFPRKGTGAWTSV